VSGNLERRYRRVLRLLPGWYRQQWEEDMVAAFLDSWLTEGVNINQCLDLLVACDGIGDDRSAVRVTD
jgi:hypothetical protein